MDHEDAENIPPANKKRFLDISNEHREMIMNGLTSENTKKVTERSIKLLRNYYVHRSQQQQTAAGIPKSPNNTVTDIDLSTRYECQICVFDTIYEEQMNERV